MARPDYLIIGTQRAGTTSLYQWLIQHPQVVPARMKEVRYFSLNYRQGMHWYGKQLGKRRHDSVHGEAEPNYLFMPEVPERVKRAVPQVKLIVLLRDPVQRAWSNYKLIKQMNLEKLSPKAAFEAEEKRVAGSRREWLYHSYKGRGRYAEQLARWFKHFPQEQFLILHSQDMFDNPAAVYRQTLDFLGLPAFQPKRWRVWNHKGQGGLHPATRKYLRDYFKPYNEQLYELLGRDLGWNE